MSIIKKIRQIELRKVDWPQISLNLLAFITLIFAPTGRGSFWGFVTFWLLSCINAYEIATSKDKTGLALWIIKAITYAGFVWKFSSEIGVFHWNYVIMICISVSSLIISRTRRFKKKRAIAMYGTCFAYLFGTGMYINAIIANPTDYGWHHIAFWIINGVSYALQIKKNKNQKINKDNYIVPVFALVVCIIYITIIAFV
jgi:hypothetical protein